MKIFFLLSLLLSCFAAPLHSAKPEKNSEPGPDPKVRRQYEIKIRDAASAFEREDYIHTGKLVAEAETLWPGQPPTINLQGALFYCEKKYPAALEKFRSLIEKDPNSYTGYFNVAEVYLAQKNYDLALEGFGRILDARPKDEACQFRVALILALQGKNDEARAFAAKIPKIGQTAAHYYAQAGIEFIAGNQRKGDDWIKQSELFFPRESSRQLRKTLVDLGLLQK